MSLQDYLNKISPVNFFKKKQPKGLHHLQRVCAYDFFSSSSVAQRLENDGYCIVNLDATVGLSDVMALYQATHSLEAKEGGVFFGVFSSDIAFKRKVHETLCNLSISLFPGLLKNHTIQIANFAIKTPGINSSVPFHQDNSSVDENTFSSVNIWIPLQDVDTKNGAVWLIPGSHRIAYAHRCASMRPYLQNVTDMLYRYAIPISLNVGQALIFDTRVFHFSNPNKGDSERVAAVYRVTDRRASTRSYYCFDDGKQQQVEAWDCPKDYLLGVQALSDIYRPSSGNLVWRRPLPVNPLQPDEFLHLAAMLGMQHRNIISKGEGSTNFLSEPHAQ